MSKEENIQKIVREIADEPRTWNELMDILDVSEATLSRYLNELREKNVVQKQFDSEDNIIYSIDPSAYFENEQMLEEVIENAKMTNRLLEGMKELGIFEEGMDEEDILEFLEEYYPIKGYETQQVEKADSLTLYIWTIFNSTLTQVFEASDTELEVEFKVKGSKEEFETDIEELKEKWNKHQED